MKDATYDQSSSSTTFARPVPLPHNVVVSALESKIDDLYRGPLSEFVSARNALAKTLSGDVIASLLLLTGRSAIEHLCTTA